MKEIKSPKDAVKGIKNGASIMIGGFMCCGQPFGLIDAILESGVTDLTVISNDAGFPDKGIGKLIVEGRVKRFIASHIGLNPVAGQKMNSGEMTIDLTPQGTLAERMRCAGAGLGGILTPTGIGTDVEKNKQKITVDGKEYLLEKPLTAEFAFIKAAKADKYGNAFIPKSEKNFNIVMAMAAQETFLETGEIVEIGQMDPDQVTLPGVFVHTLVEAK